MKELVDQSLKGEITISQFLAQNQALAAQLDRVDQH